MKLLILITLLLLCAISNAAEQTTWTSGDLNPISGADGLFDLTTYGGYNVISQTGAIVNSRYMYFQAPLSFAGLFKYPESDATVEFTLFDDIPGNISLQYCAQDYPYQNAPPNAILAGSKQWTNIIFNLSLPAFNRAQNLGTDFRTARSTDGTPNLIIREVTVTQVQLNEITKTLPTATNIFTFQADKNNLPVQPVDDDLAQSPGATNILTGSMHAAWTPNNLYKYLFNATSDGGYGVGYTSDGKVLFNDSQLNTSETIFDAPSTITEIRVFGGGHGDGRCFVNCKIYFSTDGNIYTRFIVPGTTNLMIGSGNGDDIDNYTANLDNAMARVYCTDGTPLAENVRYVKLVFRPASTSGSIMELYPSFNAVMSPVVREIDILGTSEPSKATSAKPFDLDEHIISTSFFHWYTATSGQLSGPWLPRDGRASWTGTPGWWKTQIKQVMLANIDVMYVHLIPSMEQQRINLFQALAEMRYDGYDVPKVTPFLDPIITWNPNVYSLAVEANRTMLVDQYIRFFNQYYSVNTDEYADDYLAIIDNRVTLDTWHLSVNFTDIASFHRSHMEDPLAAEFGAEHPVFTNGIYMITTDTANTFSFADEKVMQFQVHAYSRITDYNGIKSDQLKPGYWDQNIRNPGYILPRDGGVNYSNAWATYPDALTVKRVYIESWNEYDEGSGIYAANPTNTYIAPSNPSTDVWSLTDDPLEYIKTTFNAARTFKRFEFIPKDSKIIWENFPTNMIAGQTNHCTVYVRNTGFDLWTSSNNYKFGQADTDTEIFGPGRYDFNDSENETDLYLGIFKGRPVKFDVEVVAPNYSGIYETHWRMVQEGVAWFGEEITNTIYVFPIPEPVSIYYLSFIIYYLLKRTK